MGSGSDGCKAELGGGLWKFETPILPLMWYVFVYVNVYVFATFYGIFSFIWCILLSYVFFSVLCAFLGL